ncbi:hypothetical protein EIN_105000, partial [Entamoeba invadens IP1]
MLFNLLPASRYSSKSYSVRCIWTRHISYHRVGSVQCIQISKKVNGVVKSTRSTWPVLQAMNWKSYAPKYPELYGKKVTRAPTLQKLKVISWLGFIKGAKGVFYYAYYDLVYIDDKGILLCTGGGDKQSCVFKEMSEKLRFYNHRKCKPKRRKNASVVLSNGKYERILGNGIKNGEKETPG